MKSGSQSFLGLGVLLLSIIPKLAFADIAPPAPVGEAVLLARVGLALVITIGLELLVWFAYVYWKKLSKRMLWFVLLANLISLPLLWFFVSRFSGSMLISYIAIGELAVFLFEGSLVYAFNKQEIALAKSVSISFLANLTSFLAGVFVFPLVAAIFGF